MKMRRPAVPSAVAFEHIKEGVVPSAGGMMEAQLDPIML